MTRLLTLSDGLPDFGVVAAAGGEGPKSFLRSSFEDPGVASPAGTTQRDKLTQNTCS
jgi:hypothetical protein